MAYKKVYFKKGKTQNNKALGDANTDRTDS